MSETLLLKGKQYQEIVKESIQPDMPIKLSQLINDSDYVTATGSVYSVTSATNTAQITGNSGVSAGTYGPTANVSIGRTNSGSIVIPYFTVTAQGIVTSVTNRTLSITTGCSNCGYCSVCSQCNQSSGCNNCSTCSNCNNCSRCNKCSQK